VVPPTIGKAAEGLRPLEIERDAVRDRVITLYASGTVADVVLALGREGLAVVVDTAKLQTPFSAVFEGKPIEHVLAAVAGAIGDNCRVVQRKGYVWIGNPSAVDESVRVFFVSKGLASEWTTAYQMAGGVGVACTGVGDMLLVRGPSDAVDRVAAFHSTVAGMRRQLMIDVVFAELSEDETKSLGVRFTLDGLVSMGLTGTSPFEITKSLELVLSGLADGAGERSRGGSWSSTRLLVVEGETNRIQVGDNVNVRRRVTSDQGTVSDVGFDSFETGTILEISVRSVSDEVVRLDVKPEVSEVKEYNEGVPTISTRQFTSACYVAVGGVVVLGGLDRASDVTGQNLFPGLNVPTRKTSRGSRGRLFVFLHVRPLVDDSMVAQ